MSTNDLTIHERAVGVAVLFGQDQRPLVMLDRDDLSGPADLTDVERAVAIARLRAHATRLEQEGQA